MSVPSPLRHKQQGVPSQSVQARNVDSFFFLNDMFTVVATAFQQTMTELNGAKSEEGRIIAITIIVFKLNKQNGCISRNVEPLTGNDREISSYTTATATTTVDT
jgi:hypothetical protein